jgi:hypothetical protein
LRKVSEVSREDANAIQKTIAALDVTLRLTHQSVIKTTFLLYETAVSAIAGG